MAWGVVCVVFVLFRRTDDSDARGLRSFVGNYGERSIRNARRVPGGEGGRRGHGNHGCSDQVHPLSITGAR